MNRAPHGALFGSPADMTVRQAIAGLYCEPAHQPSTP